MGSHCALRRCTAAILLLLLLLLLLQQSGVRVFGRRQMRDGLDGLRLHNNVRSDRMLK
jgi:hypothetical protein